MIHLQRNLPAAQSVRMHVFCSEMLSGELVYKLTAALDETEDAGPNAILKIEIHGQSDSQIAPWPGDVNVKIVNKWEQALRRAERGQAIIAVRAFRRCSLAALELLLVGDLRTVSADLAIHLSGEGITPWPGMAMYRLVHQVGYAMARKLLLAQQVGAQLLLESGIADEVMDDNASNDDTLNLGISPAFLDELPIRRRLLQDATENQFEQALGAHLAACDRALRRKRAQTPAHSPPNPDNILEL